MLILTFIWGLNYSAIKISNIAFSPIFNSFLRSSVASVLGVFYCLSIKQPLFHRDIRLFHGFMVGLLFGLEFVCIYVGMFYTDLYQLVFSIPVIFIFCFIPIRYQSLRFLPSFPRYLEWIAHSK